MRNIQYIFFSKFNINQITKKFMKTSLFYINILGLFFFFNQQLFAQTVTYGSGAMTNTASPAAGTVGTYSTFIGSGAGLNNTSTGVHNSAFGNVAFYSNTYGDFNTAIGSSTLNSSVYGNRGTAIGTFSQQYANSQGSTWVNYNVSLGYEALRGSTTAANNTGNYNLAIGYQSLPGNTSGSNNVASGYLSLYSNTIGGSNTAIGNNSMYSNVAGSKATAIGYNAMYYTNSSGSAFDNYNVAVGYEALRGSTTAANNTGNYNAALGYQALMANTNGAYNIALGYQTLFSNTEGYKNTAIGYSALALNTTGNGNTAMGYQSLYSCTGTSNTAVGSNALFFNTSGIGNTSIGDISLYLNSTGTANTAIGKEAMYSNTTGGYNTAVGSGALYTNTTGTINTALGYAANVVSNNLSNTISVGNSAVAQSSNYIRMGNTSIATAWVQVDWTIGSDKRIKRNIQENVPGLNFIRLLKPVTYNLDIHEQNNLMGIPDTLDWDGKYDIENTKFTGLIAQQVDSAAQLIGYDFSGVDKPKNQNDIYGLRYSTFLAPLIKAVQELCQTIDSLKNHQATIDSLFLFIKNGCLPDGKNFQNNFYPENSKPETSIQVELSSNSQPFLYQNEPNPFSENTIIRYYVPENITSNVYIVFYDMYGKEIKRVDIATKGFGKIDAATENLTAGVYSFSLVVNDNLIDTKIMMKNK